VIYKLTAFDGLFHSSRVRDVSANNVNTEMLKERGLTGLSR
jgi:hypothetical protein